MTTTQSDALGELCILTKYAAIDARGLGRLPVSACSRCVLPPVLQNKKSVVQGRGHLGLGVANNSDDPAHRLPNVALGLGT